MPSKLAVQTALRDPLLWIALVLRIALLAWTIPRGHWQLGDTQYYLDSAKMVCDGAWGGGVGRTPLYSWYLCALSSLGGGIGPALCLQALLSWAVGLWLATKPRPFGRIASLLWLFDPVILIYGSFVMSDLIFAVLIFLLALQMARILPSFEKMSSSDGAVLGALMALVVLQRPIGEPLMLVSLIFLFVLTVLKRVSVKPVVTVILVTTTLLLPRLYWVHSLTGQWTLAQQGHNMILSTAGVVENSRLGLNLKDSEEKWMHDHPDAQYSAALETIKTHIPDLLFLSAKGALRTVVGHVNVEWFYAITGKGVVGPGWLKARDRIPGALQISDFFPTLLWSLGLLWTFSSSLFGYLLVWRRIRPGSPDRPSAVYLVWAALALAVLAVSPQVYGDARFRAPIWGIVMALLIIPKSPVRSVDRA